MKKKEIILLLIFIATAIIAVALTETFSEQKSKSLIFQNKNCKEQKSKLNTK